ncbi:hypothetical protein GW17_00043412 [Ensete ventricosum]|nr:hypothetical protein GW17_00043412 [Ensete ventricosum]
MRGMCRSERLPAHRPPATERYQIFGPVLSDTGLHRAVTIEISTIHDLYRQLPIDFDRYRPQLGSID